MFTLEQIEIANGRLNLGLIFSQFIDKLKSIEVCSFETLNFDSHTDYLGDIDKARGNIE